MLNITDRCSQNLGVILRRIKIEVVFDVCEQVSYLVHTCYLVFVAVFNTELHEVS